MKSISPKREKKAPTHRLDQQSVFWYKLYIMFAIIKTGGKQYIVRQGDKIKIEKIETPEGKDVVFPDVLLVADDKNEIELGAPFLKKYKVIGKVLAQGKGKKLIVYKYKAKKRYHKKQGHRQLYTEVEITDISKSAKKTAKTPKK